METKYYVDILGTIWMPSVQAATTRELTSADITRDGYDCSDNDEQVAAIEHYINKYCGDFASIDALRITKLERGVLPHSDTADGWTHTTVSERVTILRDFTEDEFYAWNDCMYADDGNEEY